MRYEQFERFRYLFTFRPVRQHPFTAAGNQLPAVRWVWLARPDTNPYA